MCVYTYIYTHMYAYIYIYTCIHHVNCMNAVPSAQRLRRAELHQRRGAQLRDREELVQRPL